MSNYRRLISYIYAYEGGIKGKNIGFAKIEARSGQCKIQVNVKKVYVGNSDMGVYLLAGNDQIFLGKIFVRNGAGEFRAAVPVQNVEKSGWSMDECYGLTIHGLEDSWQVYTTIWEDAVAHAAELHPGQSEGNDAVEHAAEVDLGEVTAECLEMETMTQIPDTIISEEAGIKDQTQHKSSIVEEIEAEIQAQSRIEDGGAPGIDGEPSAEIPEVNTDRMILQTNEVVEKQSEIVVQKLPESEILLHDMQKEAESQAIRPKEAERKTPPSWEQQARKAQPTGQNRPAMQGKPYQQAQTARGAKPSQQGQMMQPEQTPLTSEQKLEVEDRRLLELLEQEELEANQPGRLWQNFRKTYPKIEAFDYANGCEILTIKPQDIGLLPREIWGFGNNSFLLHGYYSYRYLILVKLNNPQGSARYLLGVPGHYYSNEKYMATMFGFPNFVLSKQQPSGDVRFGYWYTDINMGNQ